MSHSFYVELGSAPAYEEVLAALGEIETAAGDPADLDGPWEAGHVLQVWRPGVSTRAVELAFEEGRFSARVLACSCREDYALALDAVCRVAAAAGAEIESEEGLRFAPAARDEAHGPEWIERHVGSMVDAVLVQARDLEGDWLSMRGPTREFHLGPRLAGEILSAPREAQRGLLFDKMRALFYPDEEELYAANALSVSAPGGKPFTTTALAPGVPYVFPPVDYLTILGSEPFEIPFDALIEVLGPDAITWMDEACPRIAAIEPEDFPAFEERARAHRVDPRDRASLPTPPPRVSVPAEPEAAIPWGLLIGVLLAVAVVIYALTR